MGQAGMERGGGRGASARGRLNGEENEKNAEKRRKHEITLFQFENGRKL